MYSNAELRSGYLQNISKPGSVKFILTRDDTRCVYQTMQVVKTIYQLLSRKGIRYIQLHKTNRLAWRAIRIQTTCAPSAANASAIANPIPLIPPVTRAL